MTAVRPIEDRHMRHSSGAVYVAAISLLITTFGAAPAAGSGSGSMSTPSMGSFEKHESTPEEKATNAYNSGVRLIHKADDARADSVKVTDPAKHRKIDDRAREYYTKAQQQFADAVGLNAGLYQAWNYLGYSKRNLGDYAGALEAYDQALKLSPSYAEAIEYRGQAYLGLNRIDDAKEAYLALFASNRRLADKLLVAMKDWIGARRATPGILEAATVDELERWVDERGRITAQTAGLTPGGTANHWN
jgi:tetratricopeptide (TPR) repeat protein